VASWLQIVASTDQIIALRTARADISKVEQVSHTSHKFREHQSVSWTHLGFLGICSALNRPTVAFCNVKLSPGKSEHGLLWPKSPSLGGQAGTDPPMTLLAH
jgi:hypothetical protein